MLSLLRNLFCLSEKSRFQRAAQGFLLGVGAPLGWMCITHVMGLTRHDPLYEAVLYAYMAVGSILVIVGFALAISKSEEHFAKMSLLDPLTSLYNSRYLLTRADQEFALYQRTSQDMALIMGDIDHFKYVNDQYGHSVGDIVLQQVAKIMQNSARKVDIVARVGGEEFAVLVPNSKSKGAIILAERIRAKVEETPIMIPDGRSINVKLSLGVSSTEEFIPEVFNELYESADNALYRAKRDGRNRVVKAVETDALTGEVAC